MQTNLKSGNGNDVTFTFVYHMTEHIIDHSDRLCLYLNYIFAEEKRMLLYIIDSRVRNRITEWGY